MPEILPSFIVQQDNISPAEKEMISGCQEMTFKV
jgi:hypothetical protein